MRYTNLIAGLVGLGLLLFGAAAPGQDDATLDLCAECHEQGETFPASPHGQAMARRSEETLARSCATCHGPADQHLEEFTPETIHRQPGPEACARCHADIAAGLRRMTPAHARNDIQCLDCHRAGHEEPRAEPLLAAEPTELCGGCHADVAGSFSRPFAHREGSTPFSCTECHDIHDRKESGRWAGLANGGLCIGCHTDLAGPFVFPHAPREVDGCVTCHEPHGSVSPRLLVRRNVASLCLECHGNVPDRSFHDFTQASFPTCQKCHRAVHGSDVDPRLLDE